MTARAVSDRRFQALLQFGLVPACGMLPVEVAPVLPHQRTIDVEQLPSSPEYLPPMLPTDSDARIIFSTALPATAAPRWP